MVKKISYLSLFLFVISALIIVGLIFIYSASSIYALEKFGYAGYFFKKQLVGLLIGAVGLLFCFFIPLRYIEKLAPLAFFGGLILSGITLIKNVGSSLNGSSRWIYLYGISFQPSELLKIVFILYFSYLLTKKKENFDLSSLTRGFIPLISILLVTIIILLKQPDFGQAVTISITAFILLFIAEARNQHIILTLSAFIPISIFLVIFKPYRIKRIISFFNPWADPQGSGFQIIQSLIAIGSGNLLGVGIARSNQKFFYLPMQYTDFIFSIIAEETGFLGSIILVFMFMLFLYLGIKIAQSLEDPFSFYSTVGFVILITVQATINFFVATGLLPTKGLGLPFVSYGNSALICNMIIVGLIMNFSNNNFLYQKL